MKYFAIYLLSNGHQRSVCQINHRPILGAVVEIPDGSNQYGEVVAVGTDKPEYRLGAEFVESVSS